MVPPDRQIWRPGPSGDGGQVGARRARRTLMLRVEASGSAVASRHGHHLSDETRHDRARWR